MKEAVAEPKKEESEEEAKRNAKYDLDTILSAEEIKKDEKRMKYVKEAASGKMASLSSIQDLKDAYEAKYGEGKLFKQRKEAMKNREKKE